jgi:uncharacterized protein YgiB involved in biofilm formation
MRQRRKRSAAITLVLAGTLSGCSEPTPQRDVYTNVGDCQRDWGQPEMCQPVNDGRYARSWYYGPSYFGGAFPSGRPRPNQNAVDAVRTGERSALAPASSRYWGSSSSTTSRSSGSSGISRGGFGSSARSSGG